MDNSQSFTARRSATSSLPNFQLPPPDFNKYGFTPQLQIPQSAPQGVGSVLTPPVNLGGDGVSPVSSGINSGSSQSSLNGVSAPYNPAGYWPPPQPGSQQYPYSSAPPMSSPFSTQAHHNMYSTRGLYSPLTNNYNTNNYNTPQRDVNSSAAHESLPQPPFQLNLPPFPTGGSSGAPGSLSLPNLSQQQNHQAQTTQQPQTPQSTQQQQPRQNMHASSGSYGPRPPPTPTYSYGSSSTPQQSSFPTFTQPSPTQQTPITSGGPPNRISPTSSTHLNTMQPPPGSIGPLGYPRYIGPQYSLPGLSTQMMSNNIHSPGGQMMQIPMQGYPPHPGMQSQMYGMHPGQANNPNDKPCKCDECPTSFNRNHDLKRHKRIHLDVKPYPCNDCPKRFSRRDALKVCISVLTKWVVR